MEITVELKTIDNIPTKIVSFYQHGILHRINTFKAIKWNGLDIIVWKTPLDMSYLDIIITDNINITNLDYQMTILGYKHIKSISQNEQLRHYRLNWKK